MTNKTNIEDINTVMKIINTFKENELLGRINNRNLHFKVNKYDSLVEKMEDKIIRLKEYNAKLKEKLVNAEMGTNISLFEKEISEIENQIKLLQELLDTKN